MLDIYIYIYLSLYISIYLEERDDKERGVRPAYVSIRQHTSAYVSIRHHTSAYVSSSLDKSCIRQHTSAYVSSAESSLDESCSSVSVLLYQ